MAAVGVKKVCQGGAHEFGKVKTAGTSNWRAVPGGDDDDSPDEGMRI